MLPTDHPDLPVAYDALKQIKRGAMQAIEDKAIAEYMKAYEERGREEAEKIYFDHFNKSHGKETVLQNR